MFSLKDKIVLLTGSTGGIGKEIAYQMSLLGAKMILTGTSEERLKYLSSRLPNENDYIVSNLNNIENIEDLTNQINERGYLVDILVNNAGITKDNLSLRMSQTEWQQVIDINLTSTFLLCKFFLKKMIKNKSGKIINITSVGGHTGNVGQANYAASKSGIIGMSKSLALEYAKKNININCISPGFIKTNMTDKIDEKFKELILAKIPSNRLGEPSDVANVAAFLSSEMSNYITGETIHVNGGMYLGWQKFFFIY